MTLQVDGTARDAATSRDVLSSISGILPVFVVFLIRYEWRGGNA